jgi:hypothetical protein
VDLALGSCGLWLLLLWPCGAAAALEEAEEGEVTTAERQKQKRRRRGRQPGPSGRVPFHSFVGALRLGAALSSRRRSAVSKEIQREQAETIK